MGCASSRDIKSKGGTFGSDFMILVNSDDYESHHCFSSLVEDSKKLGKKLPGRLHIYNITKLNLSQINIKGLPSLHSLYVKLPKENIYVLSDSWEAEFFNVQMLESIYIWTQLGAKEIKFTSQQNICNSKEFNAEIGGGAFLANANLGGKYENNDTENGKMSGNIIIDNPKKINYEGLSDFINKNNIYYSKFSPQWLNIITYKLNNPTLTHIDFQYEFTKGVHCGGSIAAKFNNIGISFGLSSDKSNSVHVEYYVEFNNDENQSDIASEINKTVIVIPASEINEPINNDIINDDFVNDNNLDDIRDTCEHIISPSTIVTEDKSTNTDKIYKKKIVFVK